MLSSTNQTHKHKSHVLFLYDKCKLQRKSKAKDKKEDGSFLNQKRVKRWREAGQEEGKGDEKGIKMSCTQESAAHEECKR